MPELKLICPVCEKQFITKQCQKIYCSGHCREKHSFDKKRIEHQIATNHARQERLKNSAFVYNLEEDKFYLKSILDELQNNI